MSGDPRALEKKFAQLQVSNHRGFLMSMQQHGTRQFSVQDAQDKCDTWSINFSARPKLINVWGLQVRSVSLIGEVFFRKPLAV